jgi:hypothetical protein
MMRRGDGWLVVGVWWGGKKRWTDDVTHHAAAALRLDPPQTAERGRSENPHALIKEKNHSPVLFLEYP